MRRSAILALSVVVATCVAAVRRPVVALVRPTIVAYFPPVTPSDLAKHPDTNEAPADFQFYAAEMREPLQKAGIAFHVVYAREFTIMEGQASRVYKPKDVTVGYSSSS